VGCSRWLRLAREERWWWSGGAAEGADKEDEGAPGVGAELRVVSGSPGGDQGGVLQRHNSALMVAQQRIGSNGRWRKRAAHGEGAPFKGSTRRWLRAAETMGGNGGWERR
jgi:hypothetical protein